VHSPHVHGFWWSHIGWITSRRNFPTDYSKIRDLAKFPELVFLNRFDVLVPLLLALGLFFSGHFLEHAAPSLHTSGAQLLVWGFFISTTALFHGTSCINSLAHLMGNRRFETEDDSRNSFILSIITLGEGWHNNHHRYMSATRQGFYWWELDITYYLLKALSWTGFIWDFKGVPPSIYREAELRNHRDTVARFSMSSVQDEINTLKRVVPTAAAIALATVNSPVMSGQMKKREEPVVHKDVSELVIPAPPAASAPDSPT
jgi:stearoyl-CoA desaturase (delta-9 desaturase)